MVEAAHTGELEVVVLGEEAVQATSLDRTELGPVADQHHLGPGPVGQEDQAGQIGTGGHRCLINDHHLTALELPAAVGASGVVVFVEELGDRVGGDAGLRRQHTGCGG